MMHQRTLGPEPPREDGRTVSHAQGGRAGRTGPMTGMDQSTVRCLAERKCPGAVRREQNPIPDTEHEPPGNINFY